MRWTLLLLLTLAWAPAAVAQSVDDHLAEGDGMHDALQPDKALEHYRAAFALEQSARVAWRFARSQVDVAKQLPDRETATRDSLYEVARLYADFAVQRDADLADAHFSLALAIGQLSRTKGGRERVQSGREIHDAAERAVALDPEHDGAHHILGAWHAEVMRLSGMTRFFARTFMGADFMARANWDDAAAHLERAVAIRPEYVFHRLELGEIYVDVGRVDDAIRQLEAMLELEPATDVLDESYQERASELLAELRADGDTP
jgi:tetratricopeptide (TPR) repeat protein